MEGKRIRICFGRGDVDYFVFVSSNLACVIGIYIVIKQRIKVMERGIF